MDYLASRLELNGLYPAVVRHEVYWNGNINVYIFVLDVVFYQVRFRKLDNQIGLSDRPYTSHIFWGLTCGQRILVVTFRETCFYPAPYRFNLFICNK